MTENEISLREPQVWLNDSETEGTDDERLCTLVADWDASGHPAVFLSPLALGAQALRDALETFVDVVDEYLGGDEKGPLYRARQKAAAVIAQTRVL